MKIWTKIEICVTNRNFGEKKVFLVKTKSFFFSNFFLPKIKKKFFARRFRLVTQISIFVQIFNFYIFQDHYLRKSVPLGSTTYSVVVLETKIGQKFEFGQKFKIGQKWKFRQKLKFRKKLVSGLFNIFKLIQIFRNLKFNLPSGSKNDRISFLLSLFKKINPSEEALMNIARLDANIPINIPYPTVSPVA